MEPSRVTLEEAQELFQICMPGIKKEEEKPAADCWDRFCRAGQMRSNPAAVSKVSDGWICTEKPDVCGADLEHPVTLEVAGCVCTRGTKDRAYTGTTSGSPDHDRSNDTGRSRLCSKTGRYGLCKNSRSGSGQENNQNL